MRVHMAVQLLLNAHSISFCGRCAEYVCPASTTARVAPDVTGRANPASAQSTPLRVATDRQTTLLAASSHHQTSPAFKSRCLISQVDQFGQTQSRAVHHLQPSPEIRHRQRIINNIQQSIDVGVNTIFGRWRGIFGAAIPFAGLALKPRPVPTSQSDRAAHRRAYRACWA